MRTLILGALPTTKEQEQWYKALCALFEDAKSPLDTVQFTGTDAQRYTHAQSAIRNAQRIIADASYPSTGMGMELGWCSLWNKEVVVIAKKASTVSGLIKGCPCVKKIIYYETIQDIAKAL